MKHASGRSCPYCTSGDIWQPHFKTWLDAVLSRFGVERYECRKCRRGIFLRNRMSNAEPASGREQEANL